MKDQWFSTLTAYLNHSGTLFYKYWCLGSAPGDLGTISLTYFFTMAFFKCSQCCVLFFTQICERLHYKISKASLNLNHLVLTVKTISTSLNGDGYPILFKCIYSSFYHLKLMHTQAKASNLSPNLLSISSLIFLNSPLLFHRQIFKLGCKT